MDQTLSRPFIASEAIAAGVLTRSQLRWNYERIHQDVYIPAGTTMTGIMRTYAVWLWTRRRACISGVTAACLYTGDEIPDTRPIELITAARRPPEGVVLHAETLGADEVHTQFDMTVTTPARTALDLARRLPRDEAVAWLDKLDAAAYLRQRELDDLLSRYRGTRGMASGSESLALRDRNARSERETKLRLMLGGAGIPRPETGIVLRHGDLTATLAMGWRAAKVGIGVRQERVYTNPYDARLAVRRDDVIHALGWIEMEAADEDFRYELIHRVRTMLRTRHR